MKQRCEQEVFKKAIDYAASQWKTGAMTINQATKLAAKHYKVNAEELAKYVLEYMSTTLVKNEIKG